MKETQLAAIDPTKTYPYPVLKRDSGLGDAAIRELRRKGLRVFYVGGRAFCSGADFIAALTEHGKTSKDA